MNEQEIADLKTKAAEALCQIGRCYETGDGVGKDEAKAVKWYRMAAEQGSAQARCSNSANAICSASA